jgi:hypothetical protein
LFRVQVTVRPGIWSAAAAISESMPPEICGLTVNEGRKFLQ